MGTSDPPVRRNRLYCRTLHRSLRGDLGVVKLSLPDHLQAVARNMELLRKCKADAKVDATLRREARQAASSVQIADSDDDDDDENAGLDDVEEAAGSNDQCVDLDTLHQAFTIVKGKWADSDRRDADNIPSLRETDSHTASELEEFTAPSPDEARLGSSPDFVRISPDTLEQWRQRLSTDGSGAEPDDSDFSSDDDVPVRVRTLDTSENTEPLHPIPDRARREADPSIIERISRLGPNPTGTSVAEVVRETLPLNQKQFLVVRKILSHAIQHQGKPALDADDQMLLAVAGEGGVGKTRVIKAVELGFELLRRKDEVILLAPTGAAAYNIGGRTIHTALSIDVCDRARPSIKPQIYSLWQGRPSCLLMRSAWSVSPC
jgi:hypothetical protein